MDHENYVYLALHLERENQWNKDEDTIGKLFSETEEGYIPNNVIGIQNIESKERIVSLNNMVTQKNRIQKSNALMVYRYFDKDVQVERVSAYHFGIDGINEVRHAICKEDELGYWFMCFEEEFERLNKKG